MGTLVMPRVEIAMRSITGSSRIGQNSVIKHSDPGDFSGSMESIPLLMVYRCTDPNISHNRSDETRKSEIFEVGDFAALKSKYYRLTHTHHNRVWRHYSNVSILGTFWENYVKN